MILWPKERGPDERSIEEALPPLRHDLHRQVEPAGDLRVLLAVAGQEHDPSPDDITIRC
jgi:hypothetical protein